MIIFHLLNMVKILQVFKKTGTLEGVLSIDHLGSLVQHFEKTKIAKIVFLGRLQIALSTLQV